MPLGKIDKRKKLSKGRIGCTFIDVEADPISLEMGTVITDVSGNSFRVTIHCPEDGEFTPLLSLSNSKGFPSENFEY